MKLKEYFGEPRLLNGNKLVERWLICSRCENGNGYYSKTLAITKKMIQEAKGDGWHIVGDEILCGDCK